MTPVDQGIRDKLIFFALTIAPMLIMRRPSAAFLYPYSTFIDPDSVAYLADELPADEDAFILGAWDLVGNSIAYENYGSILYFTEKGVECDNCLLPVSVLSAGEANCVGKSMLLTSILRNRIPADRVYMAVGTLNLNRRGGHAWVRMQRGANWYVLEATLPPPLTNPWLPEASSFYKYTMEGYVNDQSFYCQEPQLCLAIQKGSCLPYVV